MIKTTLMRVQKLLPTAADVFATADMIIKVKEPQAVECSHVKRRSNSIYLLTLGTRFTTNTRSCCFRRKQYVLLMKQLQITTVAYRLLAPMSEVAGRMSIQAGAQALEKSKAGRGMLLGGVPGVEPAKVVIRWWWCGWYSTQLKWL